MDSEIVATRGRLEGALRAARDFDEGCLRCQQDRMVSRRVWLDTPAVIAAIPPKESTT